MIIYEVIVRLWRYIARNFYVLVLSIPPREEFTVKGNSARLFKEILPVSFLPKNSTDERWTTLPVIRRSQWAEGQLRVYWKRTTLCKHGYGDMFCHDFSSQWHFQDYQVLDNREFYLLLTPMAYPLKDVISSLLLTCLQRYKDCIRRPVVLQNMQCGF